MCIRDRKYPVEEEKEQVRSQEIKAFQKQQALNERPLQKDKSILTMLLNGIALISLAITMVLAIRTMFWSPDVLSYETNRDTFYTYGFICTLTYFVSAYWVLLRNKALQKSV